MKGGDIMKRKLLRNIARLNMRKEGIRRINRCIYKYWREYI